jgi:hypothetical protein
MLGVRELSKMEKTVEPSLPSSCGGSSAKIIGADAIIAKSDSAPMNQRDVGIIYLLTSSESTDAAEKSLNKTKKTPFR